MKIADIKDSAKRQRFEKALASQSQMTKFRATCQSLEIKLPKPLLNGLETKYLLKLQAQGIGPVLLQAITLRLDFPFKSYRPDFAYVNDDGKLTFVEVKGPHRFRGKGIAKVAVAAKTYPLFRFLLAEWVEKNWKINPVS